MNTYAIYKNDGEVDINAFRLLGASSKEGDETKIGFWGSGLKYAVAVLLRFGVDIKVFSGKKEIKVSKRKTKMRGESYEVITINGQPTSITTRAGKDWELWYALREVYANGLDEEGFVMTVSNAPRGEDGTTKICIEMTPAIKAIFESFDCYFSKNRVPVCTIEQNKVYNRLSSEKSIVYRRGIQVWKDAASRIYDYDIHDIGINESRVVRSGFELEWNMVRIWKKLATEDMILRLINTKVSYEINMDFSYGATVFSENWLKVLQNYEIIPQELGGYFTDRVTGKSKVLPMKLCQQLATQFGTKLQILGMTSKGVTYADKPATEEMNLLLKKAQTLLYQKLHTDTDTYPIKVVVFDDDSILGFAETETNQILLSEQAFTTPKLLAATLLEEYIHLKKGYGDNTRQMQNYLFKTIIDIISQS